MIRFLGNIEARADAKGRVFIPATFRKQLQAASEERLIMRKDVFQDCLTLYPELEQHDRGVDLTLQQLGGEVLLDRKSVV